MAEQLTFDLPVRVARGRAAFFVAPSNALGLAMIDVWPDWPEGRLLIRGPAGVGKSHLAAVWAEVAQAHVIAAAELTEGDVPYLARGPLAIEDVETLEKSAEVALLHLVNLSRAEGQSILMTSRNGAARLTLPDLRSRVGAATQVELGAPDDHLLAALLVKFFDDRQITVTPNLISYLLRRIERSPVAAQAVVARLDAVGLARQVPVTRALAREVLEGMQHQPDPLYSEQE